VTDFSAFRVLNFSERKEEWQTWSKKVLTKAKRSRIKDVQLGKNKNSDVIKEKPEEGKEEIRTVKLNEIVFAELILPFDVNDIL
jgi:hypothetical protein